MPVLDLAVLGARRRVLLRIMLGSVRSPTARSGLRSARIACALLGRQSLTIGLSDVLAFKGCDDLAATLETRHARIAQFLRGL
jgi:hypothetical protein